MNAQDDFIESLVKDQPRLLALWEIGPVQRAVLLEFAGKVAEQAVKDASKPIEDKGYRRGYLAGRARRKKDAVAAAERKRKQAFWQRAFLAALPAAFNAEGWKSDGKPVTTLDQRIDLAAKTATRAANVAGLHTSF